MPEAASRFTYKRNAFLVLLSAFARKGLEIDTFPIGFIRFCAHVFRGVRKDSFPNGFLRFLGFPYPHFSFYPASLHKTFVGRIKS